MASNSLEKNEQCDRGFRKKQESMIKYAGTGGDSSSKNMCRKKTKIMQRNIRKHYISN